MGAVPAQRPHRLVVAVTGASGAIYAQRLLEVLRLSRAADGRAIEVHLVISPAGALNIRHELQDSARMLEQLAAVTYGVRDVGAAIASGSFSTLGMLVVPCSMKTLASIAHGLADNLIARAADVVLKERRRLVLMVRETPFNLAHIRNMESVTLMGGIVFPPVPAMYQRPQSVAEIVDHTVARLLDQFGIEHTLAPEWHGRIEGADHARS